MNDQIRWLASRDADLADGLAAIRALDGISGILDSLAGSTRVRRVLLSGRVLRGERVGGKDWHDELL